MPSEIIEKNINWKLLIDHIKRQKCILFLGPGTYMYDDTTSIEAHMSKQLGVTDKTSRLIRKHYEDDGFFLFNKPSHKPAFISEIRSFYESNDFSYLQSHLKKIAQIPFHIIFTLSYDNILSNSFRDAGFDVHHDFYFKNSPPKEFILPTKERPLIYGMFGHLDQDESLVLTHNDLFDYFKSIFDAKSMSLELKQEISNSTCFIFLGIPFEKWYMQLLLRVLSLHVENAKVLNALKKFEDGSKIKHLYEEQFDIQFIPDDPLYFIDELYNQCSSAGVLKSIQTHQDLLEQALLYISSGDIANAMKIYQAWLETNHPKSEFYFSLISQMGRYENFEKDYHRGILAPHEADTLRNQITHAVLFLIEQSKKMN